jgi:Anion-transporting ATPase
MATVLATAIDRADTGALLERDLIYVAGKGGAGKTTVAAALGLAAAGSGRRTLVCELAGAERLADAYARPADGEIKLAKRLWALSVDPQAALIEWMRGQPGGAVAAAVLGRSQAFAHFVDAAPGAKELITVGKLVALARDDDAYDLVIVDGPSTGHALAMLSAPRTVGGVAPRGPVATQARGLHDFLANAERTGYVGVSLPEEMSLHELLELEDGLHEAVGHGTDLIVVDGVYPDRFSNAEAERLQELAGRGVAAGPLHAALFEHRQARVHAERVRRLREQAQAPVVTLPFVFATELGPADFELLARRLAPGG